MSENGLQNDLHHTDEKSKLLEFLVHYRLHDGRVRILKCLLFKTFV